MRSNGKDWWKLHVVAAVSLLLAMASLAQGLRASEIDLTLERVNPAVLVSAFYDACDSEGYAAAGKPVDDATPIVADVRRLDCAGLGRLLDDVLVGAGLERVVRPGPDLIREREGSDETKGWETLVYAPRHRDAADLADLAEFLVRKGQFAHKGGRRFLTPASESTSSVVATGGNGASIMRDAVDRIVFHGPPSEVAAVRAFLPQVDTATLGLSVELGVYEFQAGKSKASGLEVLGELLDGRLGLRVGGSVGGGLLSVEVADLGVVLSILDQDSRFRYVARPRLLVSDRERGQLFAGETRRVDGSVVVDGSGNPIVSKESLSAGLRLEVTPSIFAEAIDLDILQVVSEFTGNRQDQLATLERELRTRLSVSEGRVYVVAGLDLERETTGRQRFAGLTLGKSRDDSTTQIFVLVKVDRV